METPMEFNVEDIVGKRFGSLVVQRFLKSVQHKNQRNFKHYYICRCDCTQEVEIIRTNLITNHTLSCGCKKRRCRSKNPTWKGFGEISGRIWYHIKCHAKTRSLPFLVTIEKAWEVYQAQEGKCALTGLPIHLKTFKKDGKYCEWKTASLDRIDNKKGYVDGNIQWVHKNINSMRSSLPLDVFIGFCKLIAEKNKDLLIDNNLLADGFNLQKKYRHQHYV